MKLYEFVKYNENLPFVTKLFLATPVAVESFWSHTQFRRVWSHQKPSSDVNGGSFVTALEAAADGLRPRAARSATPDTRAENVGSLEWINSIRETNGSFDSCNPTVSRQMKNVNHERESNLPFVSRIEFIRFKLTNFSAHVSGAERPPVSVIGPSRRQTLPGPSKTAGRPPRLDWLPSRALSTEPTDAAPEKNPTDHQVWGIDALAPPA